jgi:hypothetical protein
MPCGGSLVERPLDSLGRQTPTSVELEADTLQQRDGLRDRWNQDVTDVRVAGERVRIHQRPLAEGDGGDATHANRAGIARRAQAESVHRRGAHPGQIVSPLFSLHALGLPHPFERYGRHPVRQAARSARLGDRARPPSEDAGLALEPCDQARMLADLLGQRTGTLGLQARDELADRGRSPCVGGAGEGLVPDCRVAHNPLERAPRHRRRGHCRLADAVDASLDTRHAQGLAAAAGRSACPPRPPTWRCHVCAHRPRPDPASRMGSGGRKRRQDVRSLKSSQRDRGVCTSAAQRANTPLWPPARPPSLFDTENFFISSSDPCQWSINLTSLWRRRLARFCIVDS